MYVHASASSVFFWDLSTFWRNVEKSKASKSMPALENKIQPPLVLNLWSSWFRLTFSPSTTFFFHKKWLLRIQRLSKAHLLGQAHQFLTITTVGPGSPRVEASHLPASDWWGKPVLLLCTKTPSRLQMPWWKHIWSQVQEGLLRT